MRQGLPRGFKVDITPLSESAAVHAGTVARVALQVRLPEGFHVQSNQPRDPTLIPTVLCVDPPENVRAVEVVFPSSTDFQQKGSTQPLAVFEREFAIGVRLMI